MHYKNGREAKENDPVVGETYSGSGVALAGVVHSLSSSGSETCNCTIAVVIPGGVNQLGCRNLKDLYHAQDALAALTPAVASEAPKAG